MVVSQVDDRDPIGADQAADVATQHAMQIVDVGDLDHRPRHLERGHGPIGAVTVMGPDILDIHTVDLADLRHQQVHEPLVGELHGDLVDGTPSTALQHVDRDDVASHRADAARDRAECARSVGQPHAHDPSGSLMVHSSHRTVAPVSARFPQQDRLLTVRSRDPRLTR